jgi:hypothetical protein
MVRLERIGERIGALLGAALLLLGCSDPALEVPLPAPAVACAPEEIATATGCCAPGSMALADGSCLEAGVPAELCAEGFAATDGRGCEPILPAPCPRGQLAVPGDTACRAPAACGSGTWVEMPADAAVEYVDPSHLGASDGSEGAPWTTLADALEAAQPGGVIALAAGSYPAPVVSKPLAIRGRCPELVEIAGGIISSFTILSSASGTHIQGVALAGAGLVVLGRDVRLEQSWIHDTVEPGVFAQPGSSVAISASLIEGARDLGIVAVDAEMIVEGSAIRDTVFAGWGGGLVAQGQSKVTLRRSVVERTSSVGIFASGSILTVDAAVVRDTARGMNDLARGMSAHDDLETGARSTVTLTGSVFERNLDAGLVIEASDALVEGCVFRDGDPSSAVPSAGVVVISGYDSGARADAILRSSTFERLVTTGILVQNSDALIEGALVRDVVPDATGLGGWGIRFLNHLSENTPASGSVVGSRVERAHNSAILVEASSATIRGTRVSDTQPDAEGGRGRGITVQYGEDDVFFEPGAATIEHTLVERSGEIGIVVGGSNATLRSVVVRGTEGNAEGRFGDGIVVMTVPIRPGLARPASALLEGVLVERSARAGVSSFGAEVAIQDSSLLCNTFQLDGESRYFFVDIPFRFDDRGNNRCGCGEARAACAVESSGLEPPIPEAPSG